MLREIPPSLIINTVSKKSYQTHFQIIIYIVFFTIKKNTSFFSYHDIGTKLSPALAMTSLC
jgi:hypothetical protein